MSWTFLKAHAMSWTFLKAPYNVLDFFKGPCNVWDVFKVHLLCVFHTKVLENYYYTLKEPPL